MIVTSLDGASAAVFRSWERLFTRAGTTVHQSSAYAAAADAGVQDRVWVVAGERMIAAFALYDGVATSLLGPHVLLTDHPPIATTVEDVAARLAAETGAELVYFPNAAAGRAPRHEPSGRLAVWTRLDSPHIDWRLPIELLWRRVCRRYGSRAERQRRRFDGSGLHERALRGAEAVDAMDVVERRSWKARAGQSMHHRDEQFVLYGALLRDGTATLATVFDGDRAVAFRLDTLVARTVCCLKWSYDEAYRRCSPGFHLLTRGLVNTWGGRDVERIDLFGSPDRLKALVSTGATARVDLAWPRGQLAHELGEERATHDERIRRAFEAGLGVRQVYADTTSRDA